MSNSSKILQMVIPSGNPNGLKIVSIAGWSGKCFMVSRQSLKEIKELPEAKLPGLYMLFGADETTGEKLAYIGESESFFGRVSSHDATKDFWQSAVVFTGDLNRAYVKYLEHKATLLASEAKRMNMQNKVQPQQNSLSEYDKIAADQYLENIKFILSALNYEVFEVLEESYLNKESYTLKGKDFSAEARILDNGDIVVLKGSLASVIESNSFGGWAKEARKRFIKEGKLVLKDNRLLLTEDTIFRSPSGAAATIAARSINGWTAWKNENGKTMDEALRQGL